MTATTSGSSVIPCLVYRDAPRAIDWLCEAFGFERRLVVPGEGGLILHAQLVHGNGMVMLGSSDKDSDYGRLMALPDEIGGRHTQTIAMRVADPDAHHARAMQHGARLFMALADAPYGGRGYACHDLEGHLWHFGSYDPWVEAHD